MTRTIARSGHLLAVQALESRRLLDATAANASPRAVLADMNGDGKADLVTLTRINAAPDVVLTIGLGRGNGTFVPSDRVLIRGNSGFALNVGDLDGDGALDVAVAGTSPLTAVPTDATFVVTALGNGDGKFRRLPSNNPAPVLVATYVPQVSRARAVTIVDVDGNGFGDVAVLGLARTSNANVQNPMIAVQWDPTLPTFAPVPPTLLSFNSLTIVNQLHTADMDGNGTNDLVATNRTPLPPSPLTVVRTDLVVAKFAPDHTATVRLGVNPLNVVPPTPSPATAAIETFGLADLDGDSAPDLIGRTNSTLRYASAANGNTPFGPVKVILALASPTAALGDFLAGDVTGDGLDDVLASNRSGPVLAVNTTAPGGPVSVRWSRVPVPGPLGAASIRESVADDILRATSDA